ncbi:extracellular solute-binding protein [Limoniibacter endophyticus]|uniref:Polyamine ABC transporter substrate-binding protein n=1 Tax=Limoniibacter endophyticus TaxID=1565040 RepID=A0A8J3GG69_9HYPH|nr:extracellular solute-binding protein [Limoniibacter endophyticus]GHC63634.1 polyamine ABC transporter substrate-binding protein [Limoniibacter endophyticus]
MGIRTIAFASIGAMSCAAAMPASAQEAITVATYGGEWGAAMQTCIIGPFTEKTGIRVTPEPGVSGVTLSKLLQQQNAPAIDVAWLDGGVSEQAAAQKVVAALDPAKITGIEAMIDEGIYKDGEGKIFALSTGFYSVGLAYNTDEVENAPTKWSDLWNDDYAGAVTFPSPANAMGVPFLAQLAKQKNADLTDLDPVLEELRTLQVAAYFDTAGSGTNLFQSGEAIIGAHYANSVYAMRDQGLSVDFAIPEGGAIGGDIRIHLVANTPHQEAAEQFVDFAVSEDAAQCMSERIFVGPATQGVELNENAKARMPWGATGTIKDLALPDWNNINENRAAVIEAFNRNVARR